VGPAGNWSRCRDFWPVCELHQ